MSIDYSSGGLAFLIHPAMSSFENSYGTHIFVDSFNHSAEISLYFTTDLSAFFADCSVGSSNPCLLSVERVH